MVLDCVVQRAGLAELGFTAASGTVTLTGILERASRLASYEHGAKAVGDEIERRLSIERPLPHDRQSAAPLAWAALGTTSAIREITVT